MSMQYSFRKNVRVKSIMIAALLGIYPAIPQSQAADNNEIGLLAAMIIAKSMISPQNSSPSLYDLLTEANKDKEGDPFTLDNQSFTKLYQRGSGEYISIVSFSMETKVLKKNQQSSEFYPTLEQFKTTKSVIDLLFQGFKQESLDEELFMTAGRAAGGDKHIQNLTINNDEENVITTQSEEESPTSTPTQSDRMNQAQAILKILSNNLINSDFEVSIILSYYDLSREVKLTLKTDRSMEAIQKIPAGYAERVCKNPMKFFENLEDWLESTLASKLITIPEMKKWQKEHDKQNYISMFS